MSKELFEKALVNCIRKIMDDYNMYYGDDMAEISSMQVSKSGNMKDQESGRRYGYKFTIGEPDFFEDGE